MRKNSSRGVTVVELLVAIAIFTVVTGIVYSVYIGGTKSLSKAELKNMLQEEGQYTQGLLSHIGMQSSGIEEIYPNKISQDGYSDEIQYFKMSVEDKDEKHVYKFVVEDLNENEVKSLKVQKLDLENGNILSENVVTSNINSFKIKPIGNVTDLADAKSVEIKIELGKKKGFSDVKYTVDTLITFRNKK